MQILADKTAATFFTKIVLSKQGEKMHTHIHVCPKTKFSKTHEIVPLAQDAKQPKDSDE